MAKINYEKIKIALRDYEEFEGSSMRATRGRTWGTGQLPDEQAKIYNAAADAGEIHYTVISYRTPIAWVNDAGEVTIPDVHYSPTTSRQQGLCRAYMAKPTCTCTVAWHQSWHR